MPPQDQKVMLPSSQGGLVRYYDEYKSKFRIKPSHVIILAIVVIFIEIFLHTFGAPAGVVSTPTFTPLHGG